jgi:nucleoside-diphosphate-sugar epimerase
MSSGPILVTGAEGFVGRHVLGRAAARGVEAVASEGDLRDTDAVRALVGRVQPSAVIHLAAGPRSSRRPLDTLADEIRMAGNLLVAAGEATVLIAGSAAQYGMRRAEPLREDVPTEPLSAYGAVKCAVERAVTAPPLQADASVVFARCFNIVGPGQGLDAPIPSWAAQLADGATTLRTGNLDVVRDFLDVRDVADAFLDLVTSGFAGIVNVGSGIPVTLRAVVDELIAQSGTNAKVERDPALVRAQDPPFIVADVARLRSATGFIPGHALNDSLADVLAEWRDRSAADAR